MTYFLRDPRRAHLIDLLDQFGSLEECSLLRKYSTELEDDMAKVDEAMYFHVLAVCKMRDEGKSAECVIGLACLASLMQEANSRGLGENDFPHSLEAIKNDLGAGDDSITLQ
jgi:hypothetical protein